MRRVGRLTITPLGVVAVTIACSEAYVEAPAASSADAGTSDGSSSDATDARAPCVIDDAAFCDDFDIDPLEKRWSRVVSEGTTLAITDAVAYSPPNALRFTFPGDAGWRVAALERRGLPAGGRVRCGASVRLDHAIGSDATSLLEYEAKVADKGGEWYQRARLTVRENGETFVVVQDQKPDGGGGPTLVPLGAFGRLSGDAFHRLELDVDFGPGGTRIVAMINGAERMNRTFPPLGAPGSEGTLTLGGDMYFDGARDFLLDDVRCSFEP